ncbi:hypothetical protein [Geodermatophilus sp. SYSU D00815]
MILAAGLLVLLGLGLFVAGLATGTSVLYWATVAVCAIAAVLLVLSRRGLSAAADRPRRPAGVARGAAASPPADAKPSRADENPADEKPDRADEKPADEEPARVDGAGAERAAAPAPPPAAVEQGEPPVEDVEVTDLLLVVDLKDEVFVVDEHPRYHLADCPRLAGFEPIPLPLDEARTDGFTPCGVCEPDRHTAERERARRRA